MAYESLVRAAVVCYLASTEGLEAAARETREQVEAGFTWTPELVDLMAEYEVSRETYPTMESFMPRVVALFGELAEAR